MIIPKRLFELASAHEPNERHLPLPTPGELMGWREAERALNEMMHRVDPEAIAWRSEHRETLADVARRIERERREEVVEAEVERLETVAEAERRLAPTATAKRKSKAAEPATAPKGNRLPRWSKRLSPKLKAAYIGQLLLQRPNLTDAELAKACRVAERTVQRWHKHPVIRKAWHNVGVVRPKAVVEKDDAGGWLIDAEAER